MTNRERFHELMNADAFIDRSPALEWATWWDKTIRFWESEGMPENMESHDIFDYFGLDDISQYWFPHKTPDCPEEKSFPHIFSTQVRSLGRFFWGSPEI